MNRRTQPKGIFLLLLTAMIWGTSFVSQSLGMEKIGPFTFQAVRTLLGAAVITPFSVLRRRTEKRDILSAEGLDALPAVRAHEWETLRAGLLVGLVLTVAANFQQFAFVYSTAGKIAFLTSLYMFFVPLLGLLVGRRVPAMTWVFVALGFLGMYLLCIDPAAMAGMNRGDLRATICAVFYAVHILCIDRYVGRVDGIRLSCLQFWVAGTLSFILMLIFEKPSAASILSAAGPLLYSGLLSCGVAYTLQILGQRWCEASVASLLMCMESVFAVLSAALVLHERLTLREGLGCAVMFTAVILSQLTEIRAARTGKDRS